MVVFHLLGSSITIKCDRERCSVHKGEQNRTYKKYSEINKVVCNNEHKYKLQCERNILSEVHQRIGQNRIKTVKYIVDRYKW